MPAQAWAQERPPPALAAGFDHAGAEGDDAGGGREGGARAAAADARRARGHEHRPGAVRSGAGAAASAGHRNGRLHAGDGQLRAAARGDPVDDGGGRRLAVLAVLRLLAVRPDRDAADLRFRADLREAARRATSTVDAQRASEQVAASGRGAQRPQGLLQRASDEGARRRGQGDPRRPEQAPRPGAGDRHRRDAAADRAGAAEGGRGQRAGAAHPGAEQLRDREGAAQPGRRDRGRHRLRRGRRDHGGDGRRGSAARGAGAQGNRGAAGDDDAREAARLAGGDAELREGDLRPLDRGGGRGDRLRRAARSARPQLERGPHGHVADLPGRAHQGPRAPGRGWPREHRRAAGPRGAAGAPRRGLGTTGRAGREGDDRRRRTTR